MTFETKPAMEPALTNAQVYPKRKRAQVSYYESGSEESDVDEFNGSTAVPSPKKRAKVNATKARPLPKKKIFPFTSLPAELKNQIYDLTLKDSNGIYFILKTKHYRRTVSRELHGATSSGNYDRRGATGNRAWNNSIHSKPSQSTSEDVKLRPLVPNLLLLSKEFHAETQPILYSGNKFAVEDTTTLHTFLAKIGAKNCASLLDLTICGWGYTKAHKAMNFPAITMLSSAVNLKRLHLDCSIAWRGGGKRSARQLYRDGFHWLEAVGALKGKFDAAIDILDVAGDNFESYAHRHGQIPLTDEEIKAAGKLEFEEEMRRLLRSDQGPKRRG